MAGKKSEMTIGTAYQAPSNLDESRFTADALAGLDTFSHVEIVFYMDKVKPEKIVTGARHPRNNPDWPKVGIFAQRAKKQAQPHWHDHLQA